MDQVYEIYIRDDDSHRDVYVGAQQDEPPRKLQIANKAVTFDGKTIFLRPACYVYIARDGNRFIYKQE